MTGAWLGRRPRDSRDAFWIAVVIGGVVGLVLAPLAIRFGADSDSDFGGFAHDGYVELARSLARGDGFVFEPGGAAVSHRPPLYPLMLAPLMLLPEPLQRAQSVEAGQPDVEHDRVVGGARQPIEAGLSALHRFDLISLVAQHAAQRAAHAGFVVDDED